jgi:RNA polymerase sigma-70 factor (sigma-E family)
VHLEDYVAQQRGALLRFAVVLSGNAVLAEDLVADALDTAFERWDRIAALAQPHAYVRRMLLNEYLDWRHRARRTQVSADLAELLAPIADHAQQHAEQAALAVELQKLPRRQRAALVLRFYEGLSYDQIAAAIGCSVATARSHVFRALARLRIEMESDDEEPAAATRRLEAQR